MLAAVAALAVVALAPRAEAQQARLTLQQVFGVPATALSIPFGNVDAACLSAPAPGVTCAPDASTQGATWYGRIQFSARATGMGGGRTVRLAGARRSLGSMPAARLLDGATGVPTIAYPVAPVAPIVLRTAIAGGSITITRSIGVLVVPADAAGVWSTPVLYSLIVE
jgi:hypothetical protein